MALLCTFLNATIGNCLTHFSLLNASSTQTSVSEHCISDLLSVYCCVFFFLRGHLCTPMWYTVMVSDSLQYSVILHAPHHFLLAIFPQLNANLMSAHILKDSSCLIFLLLNSLNGQSSDMQYRLLMHLPTFLIPIRSFLFDVSSWCLLKYLRSWLFCTHSCGEHLIWYSLKPFMSCGISSTHSASVLRNECIGNCNSLSLVLFWSESWLYRGCHLRVICKVNHINCII